MIQLWAAIDSTAGVVVALISGTFFLAGGLLSLRNWIRSRSWAKTVGTVEASAVKLRKLIDDDKTRDTYHVELEYAYVVDGRQYRSSRMFFGGQKAYETEEDARRDIWALPVGKEVTVYYDPTNAAESVLTVAMPSGVLLLPFLGAALLVAGLVLMVRSMIH